MIANALDGMTWAEAVRLASMERQGLRAVVIRYNAEGPVGLGNRPKPGRPLGLTEGGSVSSGASVVILDVEPAANHAFCMMLS
ncbi:MAG: hypothetical protein ACRYG8_35485 [Janthinobacterium lividum]